MKANYVVMAHFDAFNNIDQNFKTLLSALESKFDGVVLVSTSQIHVGELTPFTKTTLIRRPNIGYDFYGYKVGYKYIIDNFELGNILFTNSSYFILNSVAFKKALDSAIKAINSVDIVGLTSSDQISWHVQSYFLFLNSNVLNLIEIQKFFNEIKPLNSKFELIVQYELGFSRLISDMGLRCSILYTTDMLERIGSYYAWGKRVYWSTKRKLRFLEAIKESRNANLTHFCAKGLAKKIGIIKAEVVRTNPHSLDLGFVNNSTSAEILNSINESIAKSKSLYQADDSGMTNLISLGKNEMAFREVRYGKKGRVGVRIAVVIHLYYFDLLDEIASYLDAIIEPYDLYVTTPFEADIPGIINKMSTKALSVTVLLGENSGRDIGPFIKLYRSGYLDGYMAVLKLHSKKSKYSAEGQEWRRQLYQKVVGGSLVVRRVLKAFELNYAGVVGPAEYYLTDGTKFWGANYETLKKILQASGKFEENYEPELGFFAGSMFWFAPKALNDLKQIPFELVNFEVENGKQDGTLAHAYERAFCLLASKQGAPITTTDSPLKEVKFNHNLNNKIPVLKT